MALILKRRNGGGPISALDDSIMHYMMLGDGVLDGVYGSFSAAWSSGTLTIQPGIILFGGRVIEIERGTPLTVNVREQNYAMLEVTAAGTGGETESSAVRIISSTYNTATSATPASGDGTFRMALFWIDETGAASELFDRIEPGIAKNCKNLLPGGYVNGVAFESVFDSTGACLHALEATAADEASGFVGGSKNVVNESLYMPNRGVYLLQEAVLLSGESVSLASGESKAYDFADGASFGYYEGVVAVYAGTGGSLPRIEYGGAYAEQSYEFRVNDYMSAHIDRESRQVVFTNISGGAYSATGVGVKALLYGGA